jgi:hypothetical protein
LQLERDRQYAGPIDQQRPCRQRLLHTGVKLQRQIHSHRTRPELPQSVGLDQSSQRFLADQESNVMQLFGHWTATKGPWKAMRMESPTPEAHQRLADQQWVFRAHNPGGGGSEQDVIGVQSLAVSRQLAAARVTPGERL